MKLIKKIAAIMLSVMMVLGMASVVSAEGTTSGTFDNDKGTITINKAAKGETYKIYRILDLESYNGNNFAYKVRTYKTSSTYDWSTFIKGTDIDTQYVKIDNNYVTWIGEDNAERKTNFIKKALEYAHPSDSSTARIEADATQEATEETVKFENLSLGYYLIESSTGTLCALDTTHKDISINEKNNVPSVEKKVKKADDTWGDSNTASIGDTVKFKTTITAQSGARKYVLHDKMDEGLSVDYGTIVVKYRDTVVNDVYSLKKAEDIALDGKDGCTFEIVFNDSFCDGLTDNDKIVVTYAATLNEKARPKNEYKNDTWLKYGDSSKTNHGVTITKTYEIPVFKYTGSNTALADATFTLSKNDTGKNPINFTKDTTKDDTYRVVKSDEVGIEKKTEITTTKSGKFTIEGLSAGIYYLTETQAPKGYNKLKDPVTVVIKEDGTITVGTSTTSVDEVKVLNNTGTILPTTGGNGTSLIYFLGAVLALVSGVVLITKQRMKNS